MQHESARDRIIARFDSMPGKLQIAARHILDHPREVALSSMRELAAKAGVQPSTMTRLSKFLGYDGFNAIRDDHANAMRKPNDGFAARARASAQTGDDLEASALARDMLERLGQELLQLSVGDMLGRITEAAERLSAARRIYVLGLRSSHSVAWHFHYVLSLLGDKAVLLDGTAHTAGDALIWATEEDALLVVSLNPYVVQTLKLAQVARDKGMSVISVTDSAVSPLVNVSDTALLCPVENGSFFHTLTPALAISEVLCGLLANRDKAASVRALQRADDHMLATDVYAHTLPKRAL
ncbi:MurR/RpiR family transcriptional regulator [Hoeflea alexandrii]|uniref:MurR/RpiR family transcriptional regulator n=1 Tax=Hoeflea alexandrii TaxID=288436 RepID=UPI0022B045F4|nr:MurR/RpiR family transcriptional regulator [Hoeflea alexandrii]